MEVELDERDLEQLNRMADETGEAGNEDSVDDFAPKTYEKRTADSLVTLRSVDNFQGEEAKVVIISRKLCQVAIAERS